VYNSKQLLQQLLTASKGFVSLDKIQIHKELNDLQKTENFYINLNSIHQYYIKKKL